jgi:hypothetical protein
MIGGRLPLVIDPTSRGKSETRNALAAILSTGTDTVSLSER